MSVLVTADWHLSDNPRDAYRHEFQKWLRRVVKDNDVRLVLMLGDVTEDKDRHPARLVNRVVEHLDRLAQLAHVVVLRGNHDCEDPDNPFFGFVDRLENVTWVGRPTVTRLTVLGEGCLLVPHTSDWQRDWKDLPETAPWVFAHATFAGARGETGRVLRGVPASAVERFDRVYSGDVHVPQVLGNITYVGAPYTVDFGDDYVGRVMLIDGKTKHVRFEEYVGPQKKSLEFDSLDAMRDYGQKVLAESLRGYVARIRMRVSAKERESWPAIRREVVAWAESVGLVPQLVQPVVDADAAPAGKPRDRGAVRSDAQLLRDYARRSGVKAKTLAYGMSIAEEIS